MQMILICHLDLTFAEVVNRAWLLEELDGGQDSNGTEEVSKKAQTEFHVSRPSGPSMP